VNSLGHHVHIRDLRPFLLETKGIANGIQIYPCYTGSPKDSGSSSSETGKSSPASSSIPSLLASAYFSPPWRVIGRFLGAAISGRFGLLLLLYYLTSLSSRRLHRTAYVLRLGRPMVHEYRKGNYTKGHGFCFPFAFFVSLTQIVRADSGGGGFSSVQHTRIVTSFRGAPCSTFCSYEPAWITGRRSLASSHGVISLGVDFVGFVCPRL
jgi:hypothetical protein